jgi:dynein heavy chain 1
MKIFSTSVMLAFSMKHLHLLRDELVLLCNRLKEPEERSWTNENIDSIAMKHFPNINRDATLKRPILYSNWLSKDYLPVEQEELRDYVKARLKVRSVLC